MGTTVVIGTWHEREAREERHCPSYYAADHETLRTIPGDYPAKLSFEGGYTIPMPYWLLVGVDSTRVSGALYSGFGGVNFAHHDLPVGEAVKHTIQTYAYEITKLVAAGRLTLKPAFAWLACPAGTPAWKDERAPKTWAALRDMDLAAQEQAA